MNEETGISHVRRPQRNTGWIEATIQFVNAHDEDIASFTADCVERGALGSLEQAADPASEGEQQEQCASCVASQEVRVYFPESSGLQETVDLLERVTRAMKGTSRSPDARARLLRCRKIEGEEWATAWQRGFPPERVSGRFWVTPPWRPPSLPGDGVPMILEPGQAFGTGKHQTTRHCLEFLEEINEAAGGLPPSFLDVGCGSGILSIAARKLGARRVVALDIDPEALGVARRNLLLNGLSSEVLLVNGTLACCRARFDLIAANLDATTLLRQAESLPEHLEQGGLAVLSGMLAHETEGVVSALKKAGFLLISEKRDPREGWTSVFVKKP